MNITIKLGWYFTSSSVFVYLCGFKLSCFIICIHLKCYKCVYFEAFLAYFENKRCVFKCTYLYVNVSMYVCVCAPDFCLSMAKCSHFSHFHFLEEVKASTNKNGKMFSLCVACMYYRVCIYI